MVNPDRGYIVRLEPGHAYDVGSEWESRIFVPSPQFRGLGLRVLRVAGRHCVFRVDEEGRAFVADPHGAGTYVYSIGGRHRRLCSEEEELLCPGSTVALGIEDEDDEFGAAFEFRYLVRARPGA